jgi:putative ABC transport system permease protein
VHFIEAIRLALAQIRAQKLKSFFTLVGVTIGVTFLIAVVSIVGGMGRYMKDDLVGKILAVNAFELRRTPNLQLGGVDQATRRAWRSRPHITEQDVDPVAQSLTPGTLWTAYSEDNVSITSLYAPKPKTVDAQAVTADFFTIKRMKPDHGRLFTEQEYENGTPVLVIGTDVADHFFPGLDPVDRELRIGGLPYTVVGVMEKQGSVFGQSLDKFIIAPHKAPISRLLNLHGNIDGMIVQSASETGITENMERARAVMRSRRHLHPSQPDNFALETQDSALEFWNKIQSYLVLAGVALPAIGLVVGAIVIMNIMLVAVAERTHEIGIRKSLGARRIDIMRQFLIESATLSTLGAMLGIALGIGLAKFISLVTPLPAAVELWSIIVGVLVGAGVGIIAGVYPASRASLLDPIVALRQET